MKNKPKRPIIRKDKNGAVTMGPVPNVKRPSRHNHPSRGRVR